MVEAAELPPPAPSELRRLLLGDEVRRWTPEVAWRVAVREDHALLSAPACQVHNHRRWGVEMHVA